MQYVVKLGFGEQRTQAFAWFEEHGYEVAPYLKEKDIPLHLSSVVVDYKMVFGVSVTCLAAFAGSGGKAIDWATWRSKMEQ